MARKPTRKAAAEAATKELRRLTLTRKDPFDKAVTKMLGKSLRVEAVKPEPSDTRTCPVCGTVCDYVIRLCGACGSPMCETCYKEHSRMHFKVARTIGGELISKFSSTNPEIARPAAPAKTQLRFVFPE